MRPVRLLAAGALLAAVLAWALDRLLPSPVPGSLETSFRVTDRHGRVLRTYTTHDGYWRLPVRAAEVDPRFIERLLAYEDRRFYAHPGVDPLALARATWQLAVHGRVVSGGSTLSMQTVRLLHPRPRTVASKLIEVVQALRLQSRLGRAGVLDLYLSLAPYGGNLQGLASATRAYLGKGPAHLTPAEAGLLIALPQSPEARRPDRHPAAARAARDAVLRRLVRAGVLRPEAERLARTRPVPRARRPFTMLAPHLADRLRSQGRRSATVDGELQRRLEALAARHQAELGPRVTLAALVVDHARGEVLAHLGSGDYFGARHAGMLDLTRAVRSPGSTLKPFIYGLAFELGIVHPETRVSDRPLHFAGYSPANLDGRYLGELSVREALRGSRNVPAVQVLARVGPLRLIERLAGLGVRLRVPTHHEVPGLAIALGGAGLTLEELTGLYAALAQDGLYRPLRLALDQPIEGTRRLLSPLAAWYLGEILAGTAPPPGWPRGTRRIAFKTGTSYGFRDAWAIGYDPSYTVGVWVGRPDGGYSPGRLGIRAAAPILFEVLDLLPRRPPPANAPIPTGVLRVANADLPPRLRGLAPPGGTVDGDTVPPPAIRFPPAGATVAVSLDGRGEAALSLRASGGARPLHWLVDGRLLAERGDGRRARWVPEGPGQARITVIDARGRGSAVEVWVGQRSPGGPRYQP